MTTVKSKALLLALAMAVVAACTLLVGCSSGESEESSSNDAAINVVSREDGSGTRGAHGC